MNGDLCDGCGDITPADADLIFGNLILCRTCWDAAWAEFEKACRESDRKADEVRG